ncbi:Superoxide dismutase [Cu-Zn] [Cyphomyrmex costatus]|uniref:superoxide dismutase n=1 Tax=Cyphomyrmex costatus TaxID=456900 RepID=A0A151I7R9_9HYME|nr:Superoxide dismutase [Cu-Zn] [Cyphomyrmex costatus]
MKLAAFVAEHCSINSIDHLGSVVTNLDSKSEFLKFIKLHRTKCTSLMKNVIAPCMLDDLVSDIGNEFYSVIVDESTAADTKKLLYIMIRYFSKAKEKVVTSFYRLIKIETADAESLFQVFTNQLKIDNLKLENLLGIGVDGANVMVGEHKSLSSKLKSIIPHLVTVKCLCHSCHLATDTKRQVQYKSIYQLINGEDGKQPKKIAKLSGTRWLARNEAIKTILNQWDALKLHFKLAEEKERCYTAEQLYEGEIQPSLGGLHSGHLATLVAAQYQRITFPSEANGMIHETLALIMKDTVITRKPSVGLKAVVEIKALGEDGSPVDGPRGMLTIMQHSDGVRIMGTITRLNPGLHGFHVHEKGDLRKGCNSAGPHFNPYMVNHGAPSDPLRHIGDLGNIEVGEDGVARIDGMDHYLSLVGVRGAIGRALVIHAKPDDLGRGGTEESLKTGSAGERVACGVIGFL